METHAMSATRSAGFIRRSFHLPDRLAIAQLILLVLALTSIGDGLEKLITGTASNPTFLFALLGTFSGWQLARSRLNIWRSIGITVLCGTFVSFLTVGGLVVPLWVLVAAVLSTKLQLNQGKLIDMSRIAAAWDGLSETLGGLLVRLSGWVQHLEGKPTISDPLGIGLLWGLVLWLLAGWAAWMIFRHSAALPALLPGTALLAWVSFYTNSKQGIPALLLVGAELVAMQIIQNYQSSRHKWQAAGPGLDPEDVEPGLVATALGISVLLVIIGIITPSISITKMAQSIERIFERRDNRLAETLGMQPTPQDWSSGQVDGIGSSISSSHNVVSYPNLSPEVVMTITVDGYIPVPDEVLRLGEVIESPIRYYWRSQTFDFYTGLGWVMSVDETTQFEAEQVIQPVEQFPPNDFQIVAQHITRRVQGQAVLITGELLALDQQATVTWRSPGDFAGASTTSNAYTAESRVPLVTVEALRQSGSDYPEQIRQYYLQLPDDLPGRVRDLAFEITSDQTNPYDQATAIEAYLRQYPYTLDVPAPPVGRDLADFFLFDLQQGYCDYYASTMVVLARAVGIPTRLVVGYARGNYEKSNNTFIVRANNAHAWVEIYFPGSGWIEFEPTTSQPGIARLHDSDAPVEANRLPVIPAPQRPSPLVRIWRKPNFPSGWFAAAGIALLLALLIPLEGWLLRLQKPVRVVDIIQHRMYRLGHRWNLPQAGSLTPHEFARVLVARLETFAGTHHITAIFATIRRDLDWQTGLYVRSLYAGRSPSRLESRRAVHGWLGLKRRLWWLRLRFWLKHVFQLKKT
jgi:transglutaminase-like putative cysteine protease